MGAQKNRLIEMVLLNTHNICFGWEIKKITFQYALLSGGLSGSSLFAKVPISQMKCSLRWHFDSVCTVKIKTIFRDRNSTFYRNFDRQLIKMKYGLFHTYCINIWDNPLELYGFRREKTCFRGVANNKFVIGLFESTIARLNTSKIS